MISHFDTGLVAEAFDSSTKINLAYQKDKAIWFPFATPYTAQGEEEC